VSGIVAAFFSSANFSSASVAGYAVEGFLYPYWRKSFQSIQAWKIPLRFQQWHLIQFWELFLACIYYGAKSKFAPHKTVFMA
jgi:hypothetical protein